MNQNKKKGLMKALKMSVVHVSIFVLSWTPYSVMATWLVFSVQYVQYKKYWLFYNCTKLLFAFIRTVCKMLKDKKKQAQNLCIDAHIKLLHVVFKQRQTSCVKSCQVVPGCIKFSHVLSILSSCVKRSQLETRGTEKI